MAPRDERNRGPSNDNNRSQYPEGGLRAWLVVCGSFCVLFATFGFQTSVGLFQLYWSKNQLSEWSAFDISWILSVFVFLSLAVSIQMGALFDKYGPREILFIGSVGYVANFFILARCNKYWQFMLCLGILGGVSSAALITVAESIISHWFKRRQGLASGISMMGSALGGISFPLILRFALEHLSWVWAMQVVGFIILLLLVIANICIRGRLVARSVNALIDLRCFKDARFNWLTTSVFGYELILIAALGVLPTYASDAGYGDVAGFYLITAMNAGSVFGRLIPAWASDNIGRFNTLALMAFYTGLTMLVLWIPFGHSSVAILYVFAVAYGFGTGSFVSLTCACTGQICKSQDYGRYIGALDSIVSLATLISIPIGTSLQQAVSSDVMIIFLVGIVALSLITTIIARAACLDYEWKWDAKV